MRQHRLLIILAALILSSLAYLGSIVVLPSPLAQAHTYVIGSDPIDGSTIATLPATVRIFFNSPISRVSTAHVYAIQNGSLVDEGASLSSLSPSSSRELDIRLKTPGALPQGSYEVRWTAIANEDGHTSYGLIGFNLGFSGTGIAGISTLGPSTSNDLTGVRTLTLMGGLAVAWEWLAFAALILWIGILVVERFVLAGSARTAALVGRIKRQTSSLQWLCLGTLLTGEIVTLTLRSTTLTQALQGNKFSLTVLSQLLTETDYGHLWLARLALIAIAMGVLYRTNQLMETAIIPESPQRVTSNTGPLYTRITSNTGPQHPRITQQLYTNGTASLAKEFAKELQEVELAATTHAPNKRSISLGLLLAGLIALTQALSSEAAQVVQPHISAIVLYWLYLMAQGIWFGGIAYLAYVVLPFLPKNERDRRAETVALLLNRIVPYLLPGIGMVLVSALFFAEASLSTFQQLLHDPYGLTLLVQLVLILIAFLLTIYALFILRPRFTHQALLLPVVNADLPARRTRQSALEQTWHRLKRVMGIQTWLAIGILLCATLMSFYAPPVVFPDTNYNNQSTTTAITTPTATTTPTVTNTTSNIQAKQVGNLSLSLQVIPGRVSYTNTLILSLADSTGTPVTNAQVRLIANMQIMNMGTAQKTLLQGDPAYVVKFTKSEAFTMAGIWIVTINIQRSGQDTIQTTFQINIT